MTLVKRPPNDIDRGVVGLALPGATITGKYQTEWIEHTGKFERAYRIHDGETNMPSYLHFELQVERDGEAVAKALLLTYSHIVVYAAENAAEDEEQTEQPYYVYPYMICPFPDSVPAHIKTVSITFNFLYIKLWEKDAREFLNSHVSAIYFLLPTMKNADAALLGLAIEELAQRFQSDDLELGRHLTGLHMMLQLSDTMPEEEKLAVQEHLKRFQYLIKSEPDDE